jgi:ABC-type transport system involved in cytochrome c biogenesis permease subunit
MRELIYYLLNALIWAAVWAVLHFLTPSLQVSEFTASLETLLEKVPLGKLMAQNLPWQPLFGLALVILANQIEPVKQGLVRVSKLLCARFWPEKPAFLAIPTKSKNRLEFTARASTFLGQKPNLEALNRFLAREERFLWWLMTGPAGTGKSRLALEWILSINPKRSPLKPKNKYHAGFNYGGFPDPAWTPTRPTVIVVDDAGEKTSPVLAMLEGFAHAASTWDHPVRVLLLERSLPKDLEILNEQSDYLRHRHQAEPLSPVLLQPAEIEQIGVDFINMPDQGLSEEQFRKVLEVSAGNPLIALAALELVAARGEVAWQSRLDLLEEWAQRMEAKLKQQGAEAYLLLLALATFARRLPWQDAQKYLSPLPPGLKPLLDRLLYQDTAEFIPAITPDLFGEAFVLHTVNQLNSSERQSLRDAAWRANPAGVAWSLYLLHKDFPAHPCLAALDEAPQDAGALGYWGMVRVNLITDYGSAGRWDELQAAFDLLQQTALAHPAHPEFQLWLAKGAVNAALAFGTAQRWDEMQGAFELLQHTARAHPDSSEIQLRLAMGAVNAVNAFGTAQRWDDLQAAFELLQHTARAHPGSPEIQLALAMGAYNAALAFGTAQHWDNLQAAFDLLQQTARAHPGHPEIQLRLAMGVVNTVFHYGAAQRWDDLRTAFDLLRQAALAHPGHPEFQLWLAKGAVNAVNAYGTAQRLPEMQAAFDLLRQTALAHPGHPEIQLALAMGAVNATSAYGTAQRLPEMQAAFGLLRQTALAHPGHPEFQLALAMGAYNAVLHYGTAQRLPEMQAAFDLLRQIALAHPGRPEIQLELAKGAVNAVFHYGAAQRWDETQDAFELLQRTALAHPGHPEFQLWLAQGAVNAVLHYGKAQCLPEMQAAFDLLRQTALAHPGRPEIQLALAKGAWSATHAYGTAQRWDKMQAAFNLLRQTALAHPGHPEIQLRLAQGWILLAVFYQQDGKTGLVEQACAQAGSILAQWPAEPAFAPLRDLWQELCPGQVQS